MLAVFDEALLKPSLVRQAPSAYISIPTQNGGLNGGLGGARRWLGFEPEID